MPREARIVTAKKVRTGEFTGRAVRTRGSQNGFTYRMRKGSAPKPNDIAFIQDPTSEGKTMGNESNEVWLVRRKPRK